MQTMYERKEFVSYGRFLTTRKFPDPTSQTCMTTNDISQPILTRLHDGCEGVGCGINFHAES